MKRRTSIFAERLLAWSEVFFRCCFSFSGLFNSNTATLSSSDSVSLHQARPRSIPLFRTFLPGWPLVQADAVHPDRVEKRVRMSILCQLVRTYEMQIDADGKPRDQILRVASPQIRRFLERPDDEQIDIAIGPAQALRMRAEKHDLVGVAAADDEVDDAV